MLRIICCHVPSALLDETLNALTACAVEGMEVRYVILPKGDEFAYGETLAREWREALDAGDDLAVVEPDIIVDPSVIHDFLHCECEYGGRPYSWGPEVGIALGCTRFRNSFMARYPTAMIRASARRVGFRQFDVVLQRHILVREHGEQPHLCGATVPHRNPLKQLREDADATPVSVLPAW